MCDRMSISVLVLLALFSLEVCAYSTETHVWLTERAFDRSVLGTNSIVAEQMGISSSGWIFKDSAGNAQSIKGLFAAGVVLEDSGVRVFNHFFDPQNSERGLTVFGIQ